MARRIQRRWGGGPGRDDFAIDGPADDLAGRRNALSAYPWTWLRQVHGSEVVVVDVPGACAGAEADAAVTAVPGATLAIHTADCAPVTMSDDVAGVIGAAHAGWRGLVAGVLESTLDAMERLGASEVTAHIGPHIRGRCYEFGPAELDEVAGRYGDVVRTTTAAGTPALDVTRTVRVALQARGVVVHDDGGCTACEPARYFSHRARGDTGRHASVIALVP